MSILRIPKVGDKAASFSTTEAFKVLYSDETQVVLEPASLPGKTIPVPLERFTEWFHVGDLQAYNEHAETPTY